MKSIHVKFLILAGALSLACTTKVSEWVLLNAEPDQYTVIYFHKDAISDKIEVENTVLEENLKNSNAKFHKVVRDDARSPYYALYYGNRLFSKFDNPEQLKGIALSPLRQHVADEIMKGKLCVMLFLNSGNQQKDEEGGSELMKAIDSSPFKSIISVVYLNRSDLVEKHFISMLLNVENDLMNLNGPMLFGIFGKFRALEPLVAGGITSENVNYMIDFLTSDCSCLIKDDLPGTNILYSGNWDSPSIAMVNAIIDANPSLEHH